MKSSLKPDLDLAQPDGDKETPESGIKDEIKEDQVEKDDMKESRKVERDDIKESKKVSAKEKLKQKLEKL